MTDPHPLDNPVWWSLHSYHRHLAIGSGRALRYPPDVLFGAAMARSEQAGFDDLAALAAPREVIAVVGMDLPQRVAGWAILERQWLPQMVCERLRPAAAPAPLELGPADVPEMLELVGIARPGPFLERTIALGHYYGLRRDGRLVAMAGVRLHLPGYCEISTVCTHPDYRGLGFGAGLTTVVAQNMIARGETPFLSFAPHNHAARRLYARLGFTERAQIEMMVLQRRDGDS